MDKFEKQEILEEFFVRWKAGTSPKFIEQDMIKKYNPADIRTCRKIFERWIESKKPWNAIKDM